MDVNEVSTEKVDTRLGESLDFNNLTSFHIAALRSIDEDRFEFEKASERMIDSLFEMQYLKLIDANYALTPMGLKAVELAKQLGGSAERQRAATKDSIDVDDHMKGIYNNDYSGHDTDELDELHQANSGGEFN